MKKFASAFCRQWTTFIRHGWLLERERMAADMTGGQHLDDGDRPWRPMSWRPMSWRPMSWRPMAWRPMSADDLSAVHALSMRVHPNHPERAEVLAEKFRLFPRGC